MENLTKKEKRELKKQQLVNKQETQKKQQRKKITIWLIISGLILGIIIASLTWGSKSLQIPDDPNTITQEDHTKGAQNPKITLIEYSDFQCPACAAHFPLVKKLLEEYPDDLQLVYRHFPLTSIHPNALAAAYAAEAAGQQDKFFEYHDILFQRQNEWAQEQNPQSLFKSYALSIGLNLEQWENDLKTSAVKNKVIRDMAISNQLNLNSTPTFFLNGQKITNPRSFEGYKKLIDVELNKISK